MDRSDDLRVLKTLRKIKSVVSGVIGITYSLAYLSIGAMEFLMKGLTKVYDSTLAFAQEYIIFSMLIFTCIGYIFHKVIPHFELSDKVGNRIFVYLATGFTIFAIPFMLVLTIQVVIVADIAPRFQSVYQFFFAEIGSVVRLALSAIIIMYGVNVMISILLTYKRSGVGFIQAAREIIWICFLELLGLLVFLKEVILEALNSIYNAMQRR